MQLKEFPLLIMAAGKSSRMGIPKGLLPNLRGAPLLNSNIRSFFKSGGSFSLTIFGEHFSKYDETLSWPGQSLTKWHSFAGGKTRALVNPNPSNGPFSSLQLGIKLLLQEYPFPGIFVQPVDLPPVPGEVWSDLADNHFFRKEVMAFLPQFKERSGHPVLLRKDFCEHLLDLDLKEPDSRLDYQIRGLSPHQVLRVSFSDSTILANLNTQEDWKKWKHSSTESIRPK